MSFNVLRQLGLLMGLAFCLSACSGLGGSDAKSRSECQANPRSCIHEGSYDAGEREYAEKEAARLNKAGLKRLRRSASR